MLLLLEGAIIIGIVQYYQHFAIFIPVNHATKYTIISLTECIWTALDSKDFTLSHKP